MSNGVKQGGVLSAILFTPYLDKLLIRLKNSNIGCSINGCYTGALSYADDITLSCPSIRGLNRMLEICNSFAAEHNLIIIIIIIIILYFRHLSIYTIKT